MNALELANWIENGAPFGKYETAKQAVFMLRQQQAEIEALKRQVRAQDNSIAATDMMIAQFENKFGDYEKVINGNYAKVKPNEFIAAVTGKEHIVGPPIMYAEWPMRSDE